MSTTPAGRGSYRFTALPVVVLADFQYVRNVDAALGKLADVP